ncbi:acyltransferase 3 [Coniella lustricola]|uniref:Acyltransferase 3 n=1 Tax=Coniella lustricola TaxID=2025994 RepID=A0A2T3AFI0_9PEZI|nr:acyltransferase 3 [Coniella lustricola]
MALRDFVPSFVADTLWPDHKSPLATHKLHPTSYLDGLRGLAAMVVFMCHYTEENHQYLVPTYGFNVDGVSSVLQLPFLRILYSGRPMVHIFFVISGFVLAYKPLKAMRARDMEKCWGTLASSTLRRPFRLFGPCIVSTAMIAILIQMGFMYRPLPTSYMQLWAWIDAVFHQITWPWAWDFDLRPAFDVHLWSIPIEFVHSLLLFLTLLMLSRLRPRPRIVAMLILLAYVTVCGKWAAMEFYAGMILADIHITRSANAKTRHYKPVNKSLHYMVHVSLLVFALYTQGWPNFDAYRSPLIEWLYHHTPASFPPVDNLTPQKFWFVVQAIVMVWTCGELRFVKRFLEGPFPQYCGHISYALYIVHGPVLEMLQQRVAGRLYQPPMAAPGLPGYRPEVLPTGVKGLVGIETAGQRTVAWIMGLMILGPVVIWAADVFWRMVDIPMIRLARTIEMNLVDTEVELGKPQEAR